MSIGKKIKLLYMAVALILLSACMAKSEPTTEASVEEEVVTDGEVVTEEESADAESETPEWFDMELTDVRNGETFTINDFSGKVVLIETMAIWCPNCIVQQAEIRKLHEELGDPDDLVSISLDVDVNEDEEMLKAYVEEWGYDWRFAVSPKMVSRALGNLYSAQYLNPPLAPMMIIDRDGNVEHLEYGIKRLDVLLPVVEPYFQ